jgi:hypothetical protein
VVHRKSERPTTPPPFDLPSFAKDSEANFVRGRRAAADDDTEDPRSETRLVTRPTMGAPSDEEWARAMVGAPRVTMSPEDIKRLPLDHRAGFVLSLMDGTLDLETLVELAMLARADVLRLVRDLYESGVVVFR